MSLKQDRERWYADQTNLDRLSSILEDPVVMLALQMAETMTVNPHFTAPNIGFTEMQVYRGGWADRLRYFKTALEKLSKPPVKANSPGEEWKWTVDEVASEGMQ